MLTMCCEYVIVFIMSILILLVTGFLIYWLIRHPIKSFKFICIGTGLVLLGAMAWCVLMYGLTLV